jgi:hypothetical protein
MTGIALEREARRRGAARVKIFILGVYGRERIGDGVRIKIFNESVLSL